MGVGQMGNKNKQRHCPRHMERERNIRARPREAPAQASLDTGEALEPHRRHGTQGWKDHAQGVELGPLVVSTRNRL